MKHAFLYLLIAGSLLSCNSSETKTGEEVKPGDTKVASVSTTDMAFEVKDWGDWQPGNMAHAKMVMQALKAFESGDIDATLKDFADSIELRFNGLEGKFTKDSVKTMFARSRAESKSMKIEMNDFESVISKDGKKEYVSLWYKEKWEDQKGRWDSVICMDDLEIKNGKIISIDEKQRSFAKKK